MSISAAAGTLPVEMALLTDGPLPFRPLHRPFDSKEQRFSPAVLATVVAAHAAAAWLGLMATAALPQPPVEQPILISLVTPAAAPPKEVRPAEPPKANKPIEKPVARKPIEAPLPKPLPRTESVLLAPQAARQDAPPVPRAEAVAQPVAAEQVPQAEPAPPAEAPQVVATVSEPAPIEPPRFNANYLNNPAPAYPRLSRRMGEEGRVLLRVQVSTAGTPAQVELQQSSGFPRLDEVAAETVRLWKFVPARQGGRPVEAWVIVPILFSLKN